MNSRPQYVSNAKAERHSSANQNRKKSKHRISHPLRTPCERIAPPFPLSAFDSSSRHPLTNHLDPLLPSSLPLLQRVLVLRHDAALDRRLECIHRRVVELARRDLALEEDVQLGEGAAAGLGDAEVGVDDAEEAYAALVTRLGAFLSSEEGGDGEHTQKKPAKLPQSQAPGLSMWGVNTLLMMPTMLLSTVSTLVLHTARFTGATARGIKAQLTKDSSRAQQS